MKVTVYFWYFNILPSFMLSNQIGAYGYSNDCTQKIAPIHKSYKSYKCQITELDITLMFVND